MKVLSLTSLAILLIIILSSCEITETQLPLYDSSNIENGVVLLSSNGTLASPGKMRVINNSGETIYIVSRHYIYCSFSHYDLIFRNNSEWQNLVYEEGINHWSFPTPPASTDSIFTICEVSVPPVELIPGNSYETEIGNVENTGEYHIRIFYRTSEFYIPEYSGVSLSVDYFVE